MSTPLGSTSIRPAYAQNARAGKGGLSGRRFLIVTAPFGGFGRILARSLEARGAMVRRMIFNAADAASWRRPGGVVYKPGPEAWTADLAGVAHDFTDLIVFGEGGPYNRAVLSQAETLRAHVWVLENGYFRPDWITVERNGVNGSSGLPRFRQAYAAAPPVLAPPRPVGRILPHHVANISLYHIAEALGSAAFPNFVVHYPHSPLKQCVGHVRRYLGLAFRPPQTRDAQQIAARGPFFIACLQREGDMQLLRYSRYADNTAFLAATLDSFARRAPADCRLVVKNHPLDPGVVSLRRITQRLAGERGLADRVDFIDGGHLNELCRASRGMVVNNSSAALSALGFHTPVKVLGDAFFDFEGLTDQQPLDGFWTSPTPPDEALFTRFRAHVIAASQINGNYHEPRTQPLAAEGLADMFERASA
ncbi:capsular biosynthesis protein [Brevundimonas sp. PAMC22021]|uniref:capsular biosynthesis protein n=1 Tax=Brevundimonas sp. PAMC22021 TaxID=2861285 RepID=UPI001C634D75|nr:capsular biosynthesis protein [Brevundimonas sp. PAMC22021]QYF86496.1 capsular biosynthesis protein [Brevundimonas sp. PAMC22021]